MKKYELLKIDLNNLRAEQKHISDFTNVADWLKYCKNIAQQKSELLTQIEKLFK
jgi:hypothetical protein